MIAFPSYTSNRVFPKWHPADNPQLTSEFVDVVPPFHRHGNCIPSAAIRRHDFGKAKTVTIEFQSGDDVTYKNVTTVHDDKYRVTIYREAEVLAIINKGDIKNLITTEESTDGD